ncbi:unnamed protein product [Knipowitschia caucasica]
MADNERKSLVWDIRKGLFALSHDQLFQIASNVGTGPGRDSSELSSGDAEGCFKYISSFMYSKTLLEAEDRGMGDLLALKDIVDELLRTPSENAVEITGEASSQVLTSPPSESSEQDTMQPNMDNSSTSPVFSHDDVLKIIADYEKVSKTLQGLVINPTVQPAQDKNAPQARPPVVNPIVSLRDLPYLPRREFKVQGGQIGDHTSDISYNSVCRQMEEGTKEHFTESEIVRGVLKIIKPGDFKDMLVNKDDLTLAELKGLLQSHLGERNSTELFQELICAKQRDNETTQKFLYRVIGLKQRILFESKKSDSEIKYTPETIQGVFLHTVYQGIGHKDNNIRRELKPLLADQTVTDETILKQVMKVTSEESERHRRLGPTQRTKNANAHVTHVDEVKVEQTRKEAKDQKPKTDTVKDLAEKIDALTKMVDSLANIVQKERDSSASRPSATKAERLYGCTKCVQAGSKNCNHCFSCGEEGHRSIGCLKRLKQQGNESRLLQRDKQ